ncbi:hydrogenase maturation nickel metallochaperone HypA/HybF [Novipirellula artificiosorum]|uniref:Hydrogenase maturation factor HypA n=1 Tax=Novipirellula artificiosorum TaxID=2528016 RepID=A0A5C6DBX9_9BACT|nr:hydrogenase maturation nickel metallochaperone HypA [Novipirellula artificiosorum]TWU34270.1 hydrogenase nickel incorporation protein [Novipirellula artificiosorum]
MHELSIALSILEVAQETMNQYPDSELVAIHIRLGPMSGVVREALEPAYEIARESSFPNVALVIEETELMLDCPQCGGHRAAVSINDLRCCECGRMTGSIVGGREMEISALEVKDDLHDTIS